MEVQKKIIGTFSDEEIVAEVKSGNIDSFSEIVKRYNQKLYRIAISYGVYDDDAEEVLQSAYISAYEKINQFRGEAKFFTWLIRILINECLMLKRKKQKSINIPYDLVTNSAGDHLNPEQSYMEKEQKEILEKAIQQLPGKYKMVYMLKEIEGMSIEEISEALTISKINVKVRLHRAKAMLKNLIKEAADISALFTFGNERCDKVTNSVMNYIRNKETYSVH
ncbi:MAG TPA: RNA polymerase sigma factor [Ignavibacteriaceae bacterium]|nr:RNA polymerase sigma factor [Ignavibacteriaceae bacterium]